MFLLFYFSQFVLPCFEFFFACGGLRLGGFYLTLPFVYGIFIVKYVAFQVVSLLEQRALLFVLAVGFPEAVLCFFVFLGGHGEDSFFRFFLLAVAFGF